MKCPKCNKDVLETDMFCTNCGNKLEHHINEDMKDEEIKQFVPSNNPNNNEFIEGAKLKNADKINNQDFNFNGVDINQYARQSLNMGKSPREKEAIKQLNVMKIFAIVFIVVALIFGAIHLLGNRRPVYRFYGSWENTLNKFVFEKEAGGKSKFKWYQADNTYFKGDLAILKKDAVYKNSKFTNLSSYTKAIQSEKNAKDNEVYILKLTMTAYYDGEKEIPVNEDKTAIMGAVVYNSNKDLVLTNYVLDKNENRSYELRRSEEINR